MYVCTKIQYGPWRCEGIGLSDGETMERLWSFLRRFSRMTKEMRLSHRMDVLSSALLYYGIKKKRKLGRLDNGTLCVTLLLKYLASLIRVRWDRALKVQMLARETLMERIPDFFNGNYIASYVL